jgi:PAS domain S-box-containing protein
MISARGAAHETASRKSAEQALRESEENFRVLFEENPLPTILSELPSGRIAFVNKRLAAILGLPPEAIVGKTANDLGLLKNPSDQEKLTGLITGQGYVDNVEIDRVSREGRHGTDLVFMRIVTISGKPYCLTVLQDVTERKRTEQTLKQQTAELSALYSLSRDVTATLDLGQTVSAALEGMLDAARPSMAFLFVREGERLNLMQVQPPDARQRMAMIPEHRVGECMCGLAVKEGRPLYSRNIFDDPRCTWDECKKAGMKSFAALPLRSGDGIIGVIGLSSDEERDFESQARFLETLAGQVSIGISNALLYGAAQREITERKRAETALHESEARFQKIVEQAPIAMAIVGMDSTIEYINRKAVTVFGYPLQDIPTMDRWWAQAYPDAAYREEVVADWTGRVRRAIVEDREIVGDEYGVTCKDGSVKTMFISGVPVANKIFVMFEDVTERRRAEMSLRESEERFSKAFKTSPYAYMIANMEDGVIIEVNDAFTTLSGFTRDEVLGSSTLTLNFWVIEEDRKRMVATLRDSGVVERMETRLRGKNGNIVTALLFARMIKLGQRACILSIMEDITARKRAEEAVAAEKERLSVTLRSIGDGVITTDIRGCVAIMNKVAEEITGWTQREAQGKPLDAIFTIVNEFTRQPCENPVAKVLSTGQVIELANHTLLVARDGTQRVIADSGAPIKDSDGATIGVVLVFRDMTEKQKTMEAIQRAAKLDSLGILAGGIAHDFNNLLTGIFGYISLSRSVAKDSKAVEYLDATLASMNRARALTQQLLTFAKGGAPVQKTTPLVPFIQEAAQFALSGSNISCKFFLATNLRHCNIDKNQIGQVIDNIVINAQQAMPGGGALEISAENISYGEKEHPTLAQGDYVKVSIKDSGIGIPKDIIPRIFDPFYTTKSKGHGLGLATCYSIVNRHGGCIDVESEPGKGSTFHVYLPASTESAVGTPRAIVNHRGTGTILVMDDEDAVRTTVRAMLETLGYAVVCRNSGREAVDFYVNETRANRKFAALMFDLTVAGGMGGIEAVAEIRKLNKDIPVFVVSGYADNSALKDPGAFGFTAGLSKPFTLAELSELLNKYVK